MLAINRDQQRQPHGGHHFVDMGFTVRGDTFHEVVEKVRNLRISNAIPEGNPEQEVLQYYAKFFPWMVKIAETEPKPDLPSKYVRWRHWVHAVWKNPPKKLVTPKEASLRWEICKDCPYNTKFDWENYLESDEVSRRAFMLKAGQDTPENLQYCSCHRLDIGVASFLDKPEEFSAKPKDTFPPPKCWIVL